MDGYDFLCYNVGMVEKRAIAFDIGDKRIGVAISDPFNEYAMPCETYFRTKSFSADVQAIAKIALERGVGTIVCGMPVNFDGSESVQTLKTQDFIDALKKANEFARGTGRRAFYHDASARNANCRRSQAWR